MHPIEYIIEFNLSDERSSLQNLHHELAEIIKGMAWVTISEVDTQEPGIQHAYFMILEITEPEKADQLFFGVKDNDVQQLLTFLKQLPDFKATSRQLSDE
ncbi:MAG: hypothetical protein INQ03_07790 [Candidatus Heimdallarchaeota archaeon]|nr:hypothetical protein [Candidatus Heimdallarchaeota archaeon]